MTGKCLFTQLPGELRNQIYEYMLADEGRSHITLIHSPRCPRGFLDRNPSRPYLGLTQVNRLFHSEFLFRYISLRTAVIRFQDISQYAQTFPLGDEQLSHVFGTVFPILNDFNTLPCVKADAPGIDVTALMGLDWDKLPFIMTRPPMDTHFAAPLQFFYNSTLGGVIRERYWKAYFESGHFARAYMGRRQEHRWATADVLILTVLPGPQFDVEKLVKREEIVSAFSIGCQRFSSSPIVVEIQSSDEGKPSGKLGQKSGHSMWKSVKKVVSGRRGGLI